jgi:hypothetical protein
MAKAGPSVAALGGSGYAVGEGSSPVASSAGSIKRPPMRTNIRCAWMSGATCTMQREHSKVTRSSPATVTMPAGWRGCPQQGHGGSSAATMMPGIRFYGGFVKRPPRLLRKPRRANRKTAPGGSERVLAIRVQGAGRGRATFHFGRLVADAFQTEGPDRRLAALARPGPEEDRTLPGGDMGQAVPADGLRAFRGIVRDS